MYLKYAILIDAGFLKRKLGSQVAPMTVAQVEGFTQKLSKRDELKDHYLYRVYYYDAEPFRGKRLKPLTGGESEGQVYNFETVSLFEHNTRLLADLKNLPNVAVRLGGSLFQGLVCEKQSF